MALDREDTLKKAEKLLRQGKLEAAIAEYVRVTEEQPRDWNTANTLGDLYVRASQPAKAVEQYARIAEHFVQDGFYPKAAALYKKILKIAPGDEQAQLFLAEISAKQGLLVDAKAYFNTVAARRRTRGDRKGADEITVRLGTIDPADIDARIAGARVLALGGEEKRAAALFRDLYADLIEKDRQAAMAALREAVRLNPSDLEARNILARYALASGDLESARGYLDRKSAGDDPGLLLALADIELRSGRLDEVRAILQQVLSVNGDSRQSVVDLAWNYSDSSPDMAFVCLDAAVDSAIAVRQFEDAASLLQEFVTRRPAHVPALLKLVEVCVDGGLESTMCDAQTQLADAYLAAGNAAEARAIAEDLVAREPWEGAHIDRFRRALVMLRVSEPDTVIAERLSGATPFVARDHFSGAVEAPAAPAPELAFDSARPGQPQEPIRLAPDAAPPPHNPPAAASSTSGHAGAPEIDLSKVLGELDGADERPSQRPAGLGDLFKGIRKDAAQGDGADQSVQHMKLARTYLEMGMLQEATTCLKTAARSPRRRFEAAATLGRLYKEHGEITDAIEWLERAAEATVPTPEEGHALLYDLGLALEDAGETARALAVFLELQATAGEYRDVADRVDRLARVQTGG